VQQKTPEGMWGEEQTQWGEKRETELKYEEREMQKKNFLV